MIKGSPSQYVKLNIGGECRRIKVKRWKINFGWNNFRFFVLHDDQDVNEG